MKNTNIYPTVTKSRFFKSVATDEPIQEHKPEPEITDPKVAAILLKQDQAADRLIELIRILTAQGYDYEVKDDFSIKVRNKFKYYAMNQQFKYATSRKLWDYDFNTVKYKVQNIESLGGRDAHVFKDKITDVQVKAHFNLFLLQAKDKVTKHPEQANTLHNEDLRATFHKSMMWEVYYTKGNKAYWLTSEQLLENIDYNIALRNENTGEDTEQD